MDLVNIRFIEGKLIQKTGTDSGSVHGSSEAVVPDPDFNHAIVVHKIQKQVKQNVKEYRSQMFERLNFQLIWSLL